MTQVCPLRPPSCPMGTNLASTPRGQAPTTLTWGQAGVPSGWHRWHRAGQVLSSGTSTQKPQGGGGRTPNLFICPHRLVSTPKQPPKTCPHFQEHPDPATSSRGGEAGAAPTSSRPPGQDGARGTGSPRDPAKVTQQRAEEPGVRVPPAGSQQGYI